MDEVAKIINLVAVVQGLFLGLLLFFRKRNSVSNRLFSLLILAVSVSMAMNFFKTTEWTAVYYYMIFVNMSLYLVYGPLIYLYTRSVTGGMQKPWPRYVPHFAPFAAFTVYLALRHPLYDGRGGAGLFEEISRQSLFPYGHAVVLFLYIILGYIIASLLVIRKYKKELKTYFSDVEKLNLVWLTVIYAVTSAFVVLLIVLLTFNRGLASSGYKPLMEILICITFFIATYVTAYFTIRHPELFNPMVAAEKTPKYEKHRLDDTTRQGYIERLNAYMDADKPFLKDSLTARELADMVGIPAHYLSIILNSDFKQNFYLYINTYRVNEARRMLADPAFAEMNILTIAYKSGFNSKTTFNTIFRQMTGMTPSLYRKMNNPDTL